MQPVKTLYVCHIPGCKCNGHARSCHFDWTAWRESGQRSGGVCDCLHNTEGRQCQKCKAGFYRDPQRPQTAPDSCKRKKCTKYKHTKQKKTWKLMKHEQQRRELEPDYITEAKPDHNNEKPSLLPKHHLIFKIQVKEN